MLVLVTLFYVLWFRQIHSIESVGIYDRNEILISKIIVIQV